MNVHANVDSSERRTAYQDIMAKASDTDPLRQHHLRQEGAPGRHSMITWLAVAYVHHQHVDRENGRLTQDEL